MKTKAAATPKTSKAVRTKPTDSELIRMIEHDLFTVSSLTRAAWRIARSLTDGPAGESNRTEDKEEEISDLAFGLDELLVRVNNDLKVIIARTDSNYDWTAGDEDELLEDYRKLVPSEREGVRDGIRSLVDPKAATR